MQTASLARIQLLLGAALFSTGGAAIKLVSYPGWQVASLRSLVACLVLAAIWPEARRGWTAGTLAVGAAYAATLILFSLANKLTTAGNAIFLQSTAPLYLLALSPWLLRESVRKSDLVFMSVIGVGLVLLLSGQERTTDIASNPQLGNLLSIGAGITWALTVLGLRYLARISQPAANPALKAVLAGNLLAFAFAGIAAWPMEPGTAVDWMMMLYLGGAQIALAYVLVTAGLKQVTALEASLLLLLEPVLSPIWAWLVHDEQPAALALAGGCVIILASAARTLVGARR